MEPQLIWRFIPTRVGQIGSNGRLPILATLVHPHACGADINMAIQVNTGASVHPHACGADETTCINIC